MKTIFYPILDHPEYDSAYSAITVGRDGNVYFGLCSHTPGANAGLFKFDTSTNVPRLLLNLSELKGASPHGKIHTPIIEDDHGVLYFGTHFAYPYGVPQEMTYEGGHFVGYSTSTGHVEDFGIAMQHEGIITFALNKQTQVAYILTIPSSHLIELDLTTKQYRKLGQIPSKGSVCRAITIDGAGSVYGSYEDNSIFIYDPLTDKLNYMPNAFADRDTSEWESPSRGGVNKIGRKLWRCVTYDEHRQKLYGILGTDSLGFSLDCKTKLVTELFPMTNDLNRLTQVYPTLTLISGNQQLYYAPADGFFDYSRSEGIQGWTHLLSLDKNSGTMNDNGVITDGKRHIYGASAASGSDNELWLIGAVQQIEGEAVSPHHSIDGKPFQVAIINITME